MHPKGALGGPPPRPGDRRRNSRQCGPSCGNFLTDCIARRGTRSANLETSPEWRMLRGPRNASRHDARCRKTDSKHRLESTHRRKRNAIGRGDHLFLQSGCSGLCWHPFEFMEAQYLAPKRFKSSAVRGMFLSRAPRTSGRYVMTEDRCPGLWHGALSNSSVWGRPVQNLDDMRTGRFCQVQSVDGR